MGKKFTKEDHQATLDVYNQCLAEGFQHEGEPAAAVEAARRIGISQSTCRTRIRVAAERYGLEPDFSLIETIDADSPGQQIAQLSNQIKELTTQLQSKKKESLTREVIRKEIFNLSDKQVEPPKWIRGRSKQINTTGTPTLFLSDFHWGEVVDPSQIFYSNQFDLKTAHQR